MTEQLTGREHRTVWTCDKGVSESVGCSGTRQRLYIRRRCTPIPGGRLGIMKTGVCVQFWEGNGSYFSLLGGRWNTPIWVFLRSVTHIWGLISSWRVSMLTVGISR